MRNLGSFSEVQGSLEVVKVHEGGQIEGQSLDKEKDVTHLGPCTLSVPSAGSTLGFVSWLLDLLLSEFTM